MNISLDSQLQLVLTVVRSEDQPLLFQLMGEVYRSGYEYIWEDQGDWYVNLIYNRHRLHKELKRATTHYFFVEVAKRKIGILKYDFPYSPREIELPKAMKLHRLYLHPEFQGKGIAQTLLIHCEQTAIENGLSTIWLEVMSCQPQAKKFYQKMGFKHILSYNLDFERIYPDYRGIEIWKKDLT